MLLDDGRAARALFILDKQGIIRYIDIHDIDDQPDNEVLFTELRRIDPEAAASEPPEPEAVELPHGGIVMYCTKWCNDCRRARVWLKRRGLEYTEVDINATPGASQRVREWGDGSMVTPTFEIDGEIVLDFDLEKLEQLLGK